MFKFKYHAPSLDQKLPVLVYIYGGAFQTGGNTSLDLCKVIQQDDFILVCINYRVGALGFLYQEEYPTSGSNGTLDQITALKWIYENIEAFGGDASRITLIGDSAGAKSIGALNALQLPYYSQVIMVSGSYQAVRDKHTASHLTKQFKELLGDDLVSIPVKELLDGQAKICQGFNATCKFGPVMDGVVIPYDYYDIIYDDRYFKGNTFVTCNLHELDFYQMIDPKLTENYPTMTKDLFGSNDFYANSIIQQNGETPEAICKVLTDDMYRLYSYRLAKRQLDRGVNCYLSSFEFELAMHCFDFNLALKQDVAMYQNKEEALALGKEIRKCFVEFIQTGKLSKYPQNKVIVFDQKITTRNIDEFENENFPDQIYRCL